MGFYYQTDGGLSQLTLGGAKVTESTSVTEPGKMAADARQLNAAIEGTLANLVEKQREISEMSISRPVSDNILANYSIGYCLGRMAIINVDVYLEDISPYTTYLMLSVDKKPINTCTQTINTGGSAFDVSLDTNGDLKMGSAAASGAFSFRTIFVYFTN